MTSDAEVSSGSGSEKDPRDSYVDVARAGPSFVHSMSLEDGDWHWHVRCEAIWV